MSKQAKALGRAGEEAAAAWLEQRGFVIRERNVTSRYGEIDLVVERNGIIHFVEVKTRRSQTFGPVSEALSGLKQQRFGHAVQQYCQEHDIADSYQCDLIAVEKKSGRWKIEWYENVVEEEEDDE